jgi:hypothetical protein
MHCFCRGLYDSEPWELLELDFAAENAALGGSDEPTGNVCLPFVGFHALQEFVWVMQSLFVLIFNFLVTRLMTATVSYMSFHFTLDAKVTEYYALILSEISLMGLTLMLVSQLNVISLLEGYASSVTGEPWAVYNGFDG